MARSRVATIAVTLAAIGALASATGCVEDLDEPATETGPAPEYQTVHQPLAAYCTVNVTGYGTLDMESHYLPRVVMCENGNSSGGLEALKVQAVGARGYAYYKMSTSGELAPDTSDQKYDCGVEPNALVLQAVAETAGQYVEYKGEIVAAFYVAGTIAGNRDTCDPNSAGSNDPTSTEKWVTYNENKYWCVYDGETNQNLPLCNPNGAAAEQTPLGFRAEGFYKNRGCNSQNGASCLAGKGWDYERILRFYYGADIDLPYATGACVQPPPMCDVVVDGPETIIDQKDRCFTGGCADASSVFANSSGGWDDDHVYTYAWDQGVDCSGRWQLEVGTAGSYDVEVWIETTAPLSTQAPYTVRHAGTNDVVVLDMAANNGGWASLGTFDFAGGGDQWIELVDDTGEPYTGSDGKRIVWDAVRLRPAGANPMDPGPTDTGSATDTGGTPDASVGTDTSGPADTAATTATTDGLPDAAMLDGTGTGADAPDGTSTVAPQGDVDGDCSCTGVAAANGRAPLGPLAAVALGLFAFVARRRRREQHCSSVDPGRR